METKKYSGIGGQAVMEGIMMKGKDRYAIAVRKPNGEIELMTEECSDKNRGKWTKFPLIRGVFAFVDSLTMGIKALNWSSSFYDMEEENVKIPPREDELPEAVAEDDKPAESRRSRRLKDKKTEKEDKTKTSEDEAGFMMFFAVLFSIVFSVGLFILLPYFLSSVLKNYIESRLVLSVLEGLMRLLIFVAYVWLISFMKDIRRVYQYHGAEHKCINCIEHGHLLSVGNVMKSSRLHSRCGTSFMLFVMFISIILFMFIKTDSAFMRVVFRILLIPVISGISYEIIRIAGRTDNFIVKLISAPGLCLQRLTTREPDEQMVEVAIKSVEAVFDWKGYLQENFADKYPEGCFKEE